MPKEQARPEQLRQPPCSMSFTATVTPVDEEAAALIKNRRHKRGGKRTRRQEANTARFGRSAGASVGESRDSPGRTAEPADERSSTDQEDAAAGKSRASGSGAMRHPIAQDAENRAVAQLPHVALAAVSAAAWEFWLLTRKAREVAKG